MSELSTARTSCLLGHDELFMRTVMLIAALVQLPLVDVMMARGQDTAGEQDRPPNIVFVMADDLGWAELGCYGQEKIHTPHIDRLAAEGLRFTQAYAGSHVCAPSRSVLMTGLHTGHTPVRANGAGKHLADEDVTIAEMLRDAGYATGIFGKWGLGNENSPGRVTRQGFDVFVGQLEQVHAHFHYPYWLWHNDERLALPENEGRRQQQYVHDVLLEHALQFIRDHQQRPFFLYVPFTLPHVELVVPDDSERPYRGKFPQVAIPDPRQGYLGSDDGYTTFAGIVSRLDAGVGQIAALLEELKLDERTLVIFTSDNGGQGGAWSGMTDFFEGNKPLRGYKGSFYEGGIRVPLIARWPGHIEPNTTSEHLVGFQDVLPTCAELAAAEAPEGIDGYSFLPALLGKADIPSRQPLYWEHPSRGGIEQAVRAADWKLIRKSGGQVELYDLATDLSETTNVAADNPNVVARLERFLDSQHTRERQFPSIPRPTIDDYVR